MDDLAGAVAALGKRLERDLHAPGVERRVGSVHADEGGQMVHLRVLQYRVGQCLLTLAHGGKRGGLRAFGNHLNQAGVLHRKESLGHADIEKGGSHQRQSEHAQRPERPVQHPVQRAAIVGHQCIKGAAAPGAQAAVLALDLGLQQASAHHRRERQRDHRRDQDGDRQGDGKFMEQSAHHIAHEQKRNQHRDQRYGERDDGEADLLRALERRHHGRIAFFHKTGNVFDHHDRVIHHKTRGDGQRHQGQVVDGEARQIDHAKGADQRQRHGHGRNEGGTGVTQEKKKHQNHQSHCQQQFELGVIHRGTDGGGAVGDHLHIHGSRQRGLQARQQGLDAVHGLNHVGAGLALHIQDHGGGPVRPSG